MVSPSPSMPPFQPYGLMSLWDMLRNYVAQFIQLVEVLKSIEDLFATYKSERDNHLLSWAPNKVGKNHLGLLSALAEQPLTAPPLPDMAPEQLYPLLDSILEVMPNTLKAIPMPSVKDELDRIALLRHTKGTAPQITERLRELPIRIKDELKRKWFLHVNEELAKFYLETEPFGHTVAEAFPKASDDIEDAGKCLALGQGTACVMHLSRVMEVGLKSLAKTLDIPYAPSWESYLGQIRTKISEQHKNKGVDWKRDEPFFRDISGDMMTIKQAWRNPSMHVVRRYSTDEAKLIYEAVRAFMQNLSAKLSQVVDSDDPPLFDETDGQTPPQLQ